jgi:Na+/proline symporter/nitrogen-specific signal transduction histidine kinase
MLQPWFVITASFGYIGLLFAIAWYADRRARAGRSVIATPVVYSLSLAVYATAWTFYGSVGRAAHDGVGFLPIYIGPTLMILLWWFVLRKIIRVAKLARITSLADFVASRYGKSALLGGLVTVIAVIGILPYISLQLKAVASSLQILFEYPDMVMPANSGNAPILQVTAFYVATFMAIFTIAFGTRHLDVSERHEGMVAAIAFEAIVKLVAFVAVGLYVTFWLFDGFGDIFRRAAAREELAGLMAPLEAPGALANWAWMTLLSMLAIVFLPRQFQVAVIENVEEKHVRTAMWLFPLYMLAINVFVLPIAFGGLLAFPQGGVDADSFVLTLPMSRQQEFLTLLVFIGGISAATGMVIVETIALSTMVCNDLIMPLLLRWRRLNLAGRGDLSSLLLDIRRGAIVVILMLGYLYYVAAGEAYALVSIGLISFAAVAQFAPAFFGGLYWKGGTRNGAVAGLSLGFVVWLYTLLLPAFAKSGWFGMDIVAYGPFGIEALRPTGLFGLAGLDQITHAMIWSMIANIGAYVLVSITGRQSATEASQATLFVDVFTQTGERGQQWRRPTTSVSALQTLLGRFLGPTRAAELFEAYATVRGMRSVDELEGDATLVSFAELQLAGTIGAASAHTIVATVAQEEALGIDEVMTIIDEASHVIAYSHQLEEKQHELEAATASLKAANERLKELDRLKDDFISTVTHELRTPLTSIRAFSEILYDNPDVDEAERHRFLGLVIKESERLTRLINQVLDLAKLESGLAEWQSGDVDLREVVADAVGATSQIFKAREVAIDAKLPARVPLVVADRDRVMQVMLNLLSNAVKFCPVRTGRVEVRLAEDEVGVRVDIQDNGVGISREHQAVIFEKFRQVGDTLTQKPAGTGLGLAICRQIVSRLGGRLWVESEPGRGSTFSFTLPRALDTAPARAEAVGA